MTYPKKTLQLRPRRGAAGDLPGWVNPPDVWDQADNIVFRQRVAERADNLAAVYDPPTVAPYILRNLQIAGVNYWVYCGATASYVVTVATHTDITHASGQTSQTDVSKLSLELLNGVPIFNNAADEPMYWDGNAANNFVTLPDWTATESCALLVPHRFHLFALGIDGPAGVFPDQIKWSDAAAPGNVPAAWTPAATNEAGSATLSDTPGPLVSAASLRASLGVYKSGSFHLVDYIGGQEVFSVRTAFSQLGALCRHAVADINGTHLVVTDGDVVLNDGVNPRSIVQNRRRRFLFNQLDQDNFQNLFVTYYKDQGEVWVCFPVSGNEFATRAMIYDIANDAWGDRELDGIAFAASGIINDTAPDETWDADTDVWDSDTTIWNAVNFSLATETLVLADPATPEFRQVGTGSNSLTSTLSKQDLDFGQPERFKFVKRVHLRVEADTSIDFSVRVGTRNATGEAITWTATQTMQSDDQFINVLATGRLISVEVAATTDKPFKITGLDVEAEMRGYH